RRRLPVRVRGRPGRAREAAARAAARRARRLIYTLGVPTRRTRRQLLKELGVVSAGSILVRPGTAAQSAPPSPDRTILPRPSTTGVFIPPPGRSFMKFSFDFPEPSIAFDGLEFGFRVFTHENVYGLSPARLTTAAIDGGLEITCAELTWAGGQERASGRVTARLTRRDGAVQCAATASMERPIKAIAAIVRGIPRGRISAAGSAFFDPRDDEVLLGYPFSGGDLFGPQGNGGLTTPLVLVQPPGGEAIVAIASLDDRVRTKRVYLQPGEQGYRVEAIVEAEAWRPSNTFDAPPWRIARATTVRAAADAHYAHVERAFRIPRWDA